MGRFNGLRMPDEYIEGWEKLPLDEHQQWWMIGYEDGQSAADFGLWINRFDKRSKDRTIEDLQHRLATYEEREAARERVLQKLSEEKENKKQLRAEDREATQTLED